ncbi:YgfZ/GcvT domain-containing protein [Shinella sp. G-2]|uniref:CAF17-like 4Fe-4S cluster assembly/insertion protein YgfZ n=1 Tax=Shinella sp. G-2 TaxID=3133141 RepID=UPI003D018418
MPSVTLSGRAFLRLSGKDAETFLQSLITTNLPDLPDGEIRPGALLTPQGKILFDFLIRRDGAEAFLIETSEDQRDALLKRLTMYKLRAAVDLAVVAGDAVTITWDAASADAPRDARFARAGLDVSRRPGDGGDSGDGDAALYDTLRISAGIPEAGRDYALSDAFPHDALFDLSSGLSFRKGCYVGQEVVSRMQHRGTARRRPVIVKGDGALAAPGTDLLAGGKPIGALGSVSGALGLAIVRIDRAADAINSGTPITADGAPVHVELPAWTGLAFPDDSAEVPAQ